MGRSFGFANAPLPYSLVMRGDARSPAVQGVGAHSPFGMKNGACKLRRPIQAMNQNVIVDKLWIVLCLKSDKVNIRGLIMCSEGGVASNEMQQYFNRVYIQLFYTLGHASVPEMGKRLS